MKILYVVIDGKISGGNQVCLTLLQSALSAGYEVELLAPEHGLFTKHLVEQGIKVHILKLARSFQWYKALQLATLLKEQSVDLVHTHTSLNSEILCRLACSLVRIPIICHQHDPTDVYNANALIAAYQRRLDWLTSKLVSRFVAVSYYRQLALTQGRGYQPNKVKLIYNGIDTERFALRNSRNAVRTGWKLQPEEIAIGLIARIDPSKGQATLIEAVPLIQERHPQTKFYLIGDDHFPGKPYFTSYSQRIQQLGVEQSCILLGFRSDVYQIIQALDMVVLPSLWEGHPLVLLEALTAQKPVVASKVGGIPEVITHGQNGLLISPCDPEALANAVCFLIENPEKAIDMATKGYKDIKVKFNQTQMVEQVLSMYDELLVK